MISFVNAQKLVNKYYEVSSVLKETGTLNENGFPIGVWKYYLKSGKLDYTIDWNSNYIKKYYLTGELKEKGTFIPETGVHVGLWISYYQDGEIKAQLVYDDNGNIKTLSKK